MINEERGTTVLYIFLDERSDLKKLHEKLIATLCDDTSELSEINVWFWKFRNSDLSCRDLPRPGDHH
jgi:hypothetical protein